MALILPVQWLKIGKLGPNQATGVWILVNSVVPTLFVSGLLALVSGYFFLKVSCVGWIVGDLVLEHELCVFLRCLWVCERVAFAFCPFCWINDDFFIERLLKVSCYVLEYTEF